MRSLLAAFAVLALATSASAVTPVDYPCVTWIKSSSNVNTPDPSQLFAAAHTYVQEYTRTECTTMGEVFPCFADKPGVYNWGHHQYNRYAVPSDSCRTIANGSVTFANEFYLPKKGPQYKTWKWHEAKKGGPVPDRAIRFGDAVMARSTVSPPGQCAGKGFTGWALGQTNGTFGDVHFSIVDAPFTTETFEVAVCEAYVPTHAPPTPVPTTMVPPTPVPTTMVPPTPVPTTRVPPTPVPTTMVPPTPVPTTKVPPTPVPTTMAPVTTFSPTLPPNNKPYLRFANTVPSANNITATITQGSTSYTWTDYGFGEFSNWVEIFAANIPGTITLKSGGRTLLTTSVILTPGPLIVAVKDMWPPVVSSNVETIAASYVPPTSGSGVRLFNLSPDTAAASMSQAGKTLVSDIMYADGSEWAPVPKGMGSYTVTDFSTGATVATDSFRAPPAPFVFSNFLIGLQNTTGSSSTYGTRLVPLADAPEF